MNRGERGGHGRTSDRRRLKRRGFRTACGTTIYSMRESASAIGLTSGSLDDPARFAPDMHIWTSSRQPWVKLADGLPVFEEES